MVLEKTLERLLDARRSNQSIPKKINPENSLEKTDAESESPILWPTDAKSKLVGKTLMLAKIEGNRRKRQQRMRWLDGITDSVDINLSRQILEDNEVQGNLVCCSPWGCRVRQDLASA